MSTEITETTPLNIFVTDGSSGVGQAVVHQLVSAGHKVFATTGDTHGGHAIRNNGGLPAFSDLTRATELRASLKSFEIDVVVNLAPQVGNQIPLINNVWDAEIVKQQTLALIEACKDTGVKFFIHTSYTYVYGDHQGITVTETTKPVKSDNPAIKSALAAEKAVLKSGIPAAILRFGHIYGAESTAMDTLGKQLIAGTPVMSTKAVTNWIHAEDAAEAIRRVIMAQPAGEIYNVVDGHPASSEAFLKAFSAAYGLQAPNRFLDFIARGRINKVQRDLMNYSAVATSDKISNTLGWTPTYKTQVAGIERLLLSWRAKEAIS